MRMSPDAHSESLRCCVWSCRCDAFRPAPVQIRSCDLCGHSWVRHALQKLEARRASGCGPVEVAVPGLVLDLSSLVLYGAQAVPVRLKILLDRLYSVLTPDQAGHILQTLGWSLGDYVRGYKLQDPSGRALDRWLVATPEEEQLILRQFLRFGETRAIVELMSHAIHAEDELKDQRRTCPTAPYLTPPTQDLVPSYNPTLQKLNANKMAEKHNNVKFVVKPDPDKPRPPPPPPLTVDPDSKRDECFSPLSSFYPDTFTPSFSTKPSRNSVPVSVSSSFFCPPFGPGASLLSGPSSCASVAGRKGRVCCGVCGKSFYDKGTLKIHYNAVHLKIKHRCTVSGCSMVFSSLRSRNRHSANPNPRLHTNSGQYKDGQCRIVNNTQGNPQDDELWPQNGDSLSQQNTEVFFKRDTSPSEPLQLLSAIPVPDTDCLEDAGSREMSNYNLSKTQIHDLKGAPQWEVAPKKKPRKSRTPVKIEREKPDEEPLGFRH